MRMIGSLHNENDTRRFCDYLLTRRIAAHAEQAGGGPWQVWVEDDDRLDDGAAELAAFRADPRNPMYDTAAAASQIRKVEYRAAERRRRNFRDVRTTMFSPQAAAAAPVTLALVVVSAIVTVGLNYGTGGLPDQIYHWLAFHPAEQTHRPFSYITHHGQLWRLVTPIFLHFGWPHILFNGLAMLDVGRRVEGPRGSLRFAALALVLAVATCVAQAGWDLLWPAGYVGFGGLSGVIAGLFGYAWACGKLRPYEGVHITPNEAGYILGWLVICSLGFVGPIANAAHWGGLLMGAGLGALPGVWKRR